MHNDQEKVVWLLLAGLLAASSGCATTRSREVAPAPPIALDRSTVRLEGWFSARGEWMVNSIKDYETYNPLGKQESERCVSVVNGTGAERSEFAALDGQKVVVTGLVIPYEELQTGTSFADRALSRRYYKNEVVLNSCLRQLVFVAGSIRTG